MAAFARLQAGGFNGAAIRACLDRSICEEKSKWPVQQQYAGKQYLGRLWRC
jgi:hypothetical protein